jgi:hypothetical protein
MMEGCFWRIDMGKGRDGNGCSGSICLAREDGSKRSSREDLGLDMAYDIPEIERKELFLSTIFFQIIQRAIKALQKRCCASDTSECVAALFFPLLPWLFDIVHVGKEIR